MRTFLLLALAACATEPTVPPQPQAQLVPSPRPQPIFDARSVAADQLNPQECESAARQLRQSNPDQGWQLLVACVDRARWPRGEFTQLELLTRGPWDSDLSTRPDAPRIVAKVIASRGGDVEGDIPLAQKSRVPIFTLAAALRQPDVYRGRWVLVRGALSEMKQEGAKTAAMLRETSLRATSREVQVGTMSRTEHSGSTSVNAQVQTTRYGNAQGSAQISNRGKTETSTLKQKYENERIETGRVAVGKLAQADPFLEPDKDFLWMGRFDGVRPGDDEQPVAILSIAAYFPPNALLIQ
ncbi:MAG TPA: hypothetical protein VLW85_04785 [Myxococcales bacterium]|nr:hypothetical protein [Myxococcales bacterium]